jgi:hypothetical protein
MRRLLGMVLGVAVLGVVGCDSNDRDDHYNDDYRRGEVISRDRDWDGDRDWDRRDTDLRDRDRDWERRERWDDDRWNRDRDWDDRDWDDRDDNVRDDPRYRDVPWGQPRDPR